MSHNIFLILFLLTRSNKMCVQGIKPRCENQWYLVHSSKHKILTHLGALWRYWLVVFRCSHGEWWYLIWLRGLSKKWCRMSMCFVREWFIGLFANLMALSLSHKSGILVNSHPKSFNVCFIQSSWAQHAPATTYSASVVDKAMEFCFLELQDTKDRPINWQVLVVLFLVYFATSIIRTRIAK